MKRPSSFCIISLIVLSLSCMSMPSSFSEEAKPAELALSLEKCIELALENNLDVQALKIDPEISKLTYEIAKTIFDPVLSASSTKDYYKRGPTSVILAGDSNQYSLSLGGEALTGGTYGISLNARRDAQTSIREFLPPLTYETGFFLSFKQPLLKNFGREVTRYNILVSKNNYDMSNSIFRQVVIETVAQAEQAYWNFVGASDYFNVQKESLRLAQEQLERNKIMVKVGTKAPIDVTEAEATVAQRVLSVINAENLVKTTEDALRSILSITPESPYWIASVTPSDRPSFEAVTVNLDESIKTAFSKRPELEETQLSLRTLELTMRYQKNQQLPKLDLTSTYGWIGSATKSIGPDLIWGTADDIVVGMSDSFDDLKERENKNWSLGLDFNIPIRNRAAARQFVISKLNYDKANLQYRSLEEKIAIEVKEAVRGVEMNLKKLDAAKASRILSKERLNAIQKKFENGMATNFEVSEYQQLLAAAETEEIQSLISYNIALMSLEKAKGNLLESRGIILESSGE